MGIPSKILGILVRAAQRCMFVQRQPFGGRISQVSVRSDHVGRITRAAAVTAAAYGLVAAPLLAQGVSGKIQGHVLDQTGAPIANAQVFVVNTTFGATTNSDGFYFINNVLVGTVTLQAGFIGYKAVRFEGVRILSGQTLTQDVTD